jgi:hypothetical protein
VNLGVSRIVAVTFALSGFAVAIIAGLAAGNPASRVLGTAIIAMLVCNLVGIAIGAVAQRIVADHIAAYHGHRPLPGAGSGGAAAAQSTIQQNSDRRS